METAIGKQTKQVEAQHLSIGDKLFTGVVTHAPSVGIKTPRGKVELGVNGYLKTWCKYTKITVFIAPLIPFVVDEMSSVYFR